MFTQILKKVPLQIRMLALVFALTLIGFVGYGLVSANPNTPMSCGTNPNEPDDQGNSHWLTPGSPLSGVLCFDEVLGPDVDHARVPQVSPDHQSQTATFTIQQAEPVTNTWYMLTLTGPGGTQTYLAESQPTSGTVVLSTTLDFGVYTLDMEDLLMGSSSYTLSVSFDGPQQVVPEPEAHLTLNTNEIQVHQTVAYTITWNCWIEGLCNLARIFDGDGSSNPYTLAISGASGIITHTSSVYHSPGNYAFVTEVRYAPGSTVVFPNIEFVRVIDPTQPTIPPFPTNTATITPTDTPIATITPTLTVTTTATVTPTETVVVTSTWTPTLEPTLTVTPTITVTPTETVTPTATIEPSATPTLIILEEVTIIPVPSPTPPVRWWVWIPTLWKPSAP